MRPAFVAATLFALLLALPAATLARPIEEGPRSELLVEGHTVFLTIDSHLPFEPAAASLARAQRAEPIMPTQPSGVRTQVHRDPGVLWFNDQYLTAPEVTITQTESLGTQNINSSRFGAAVAVLVRSDEGDKVREPCGGAVLAVNAGDADPRPYLGPEFALDWTYLESYLVADPNQHVWTVDKYELFLPSPRPVWVVNLLGAPTFVPDVDRAPADDCVDEKQMLEALADEPTQLVTRSPTRTLACGLEVDKGDLLVGTTGNPDLSVPHYAGFPVWTDDPCMGYMEPSRNGYCYHGPMARDADWDGDVDKDDCILQRETDEQARRYNALLYVDWADLTVAGMPRDHSDPMIDASSNGCQSATEHPCPGETAWDPAGAMDDEEGNSHSFHPGAPTHEEGSWCPAQTLGPNPANHAGSLTGVCDYAHATAYVEVYYSGSTRPLEPADRIYTVGDLAGEADPFGDFHTAYPWLY